MKNNSINPKLIANQRVTYLRDLKSAVNLKNFISELDQRYGVDSSDANNTFGRIFLDNAIITSGVGNTLFLAHADGVIASEKELPKHKKTPTGVPYGEILAFKIKKENQVVLSDDDLLQLNSLRQLFTKEVKENSYLYPEITTRKIEDEARKEGRFLSLKSMGKNLRRYYCDKLLEEQGFANSEYCFAKDFVIPKLNPDDENSTAVFSVEYELLDSNVAPYFALTLTGEDFAGFAIDLLPKGEVATDFCDKWKIFHCSTLTKEEFEELMLDLEVLSSNYEEEE
jgi:hypothetical protein